MRFDVLIEEILNEQELIGSKVCCDQTHIAGINIKYDQLSANSISVVSSIIASFELSADRQNALSGSS